MTEAIETFFVAWGETDAEKRAGMIAGAMGDGFTYADPRTPGPIHEIGALTDYVAMFSANAPGWQARAERIDTTAGHHRATVSFGGMGPDGQEMRQVGQYFAETDETGRIVTLVGFVGLGEI